MDDQGTGAPAFLDVLDALVNRDSAPPGFPGRVTIGVREGGHYRFWSAHFGPLEATTTFSHELPEEADAILLLSEEDAAAALRGEVNREPEVMMVHGDTALLRRVVTRYTSRTDWIGIRLGAAL
ncbi:MAG: hypothetical protein AAF658_14340 [Myxococcota bacterium]